MPFSTQKSSVDVLLVEDNPGDVLLTQEIFKMAIPEAYLHVVHDGEEALRFLYKQEEFADAITPDLILLDLNLPRMDGREVLENIKFDRNLKRIPVVVLTSSASEKDVIHMYDNHANCYIVKPNDYQKFYEIVTLIKQFWLHLVQLPKLSKKVNNLSIS